MKMELERLWQRFPLQYRILKYAAVWFISGVGIGSAVEGQCGPGAIAQCLREASQILSQNQTLELAQGIVLNAPPACTSVELTAIARAQLGAEDFRRFERVYRSFFFFDPSDVIYAQSLRGVQEVDEPTQFNRRGEYPFDGYFAARHALTQAAPDLLGVHRALLSASSISPEHVRWMQRTGSPPVVPTHAEGSSADQLGRFRDDCAFFQIDPKSFARGSLLDHGGDGDAKHTLRQAVGANSFLQYREDPVGSGTTSGISRVEYPCVDNLSSLTRVLRYLGPSLTEPLRAQLATLERSFRGSGEKSDPRALQKELMAGLVNAQFAQVRHLLRSMDPKKDRTRIIDAVANFEHHLIAIQPFSSGNARISRLLAESLLEERGLNPPIHFDYAEEALLRPAAFRAAFQEAVRQSDRLVAGACARFQGVESLNIAGIIGFNQKEVGLQTYLDWVRKKKLGLQVRPDTAVSSGDARMQIAGIIGTLKREIEGGRSDLSSYRAALLETPADPRETAVGRELRLIEVLSQPLTQIRKLFTWQPRALTNSYLQQGQIAAQVEPRGDSYAQTNFAGYGIYTDASASGSSAYGGQGTDLVVVDIPEQERVVDLKDPKVLGRLHENGLFAQDLRFLNVGHPVKYHSTGERDHDWFVYKRVLGPEQFHIAKPEDFNPVEMTRLRFQMKTPQAIATMDQLIQTAKRQYEEQLLRNSSARSLFWTPFGDCYQKLADGKLYLISVSMCEGRLGNQIAYDAFAKNCLKLTPEGAVYGLATPEECPSADRPKRLPRSQQAREFTLATGSSRSAEELQVLERDNFLIEDADTPNASYQVIGKNQYLNPFLKSFASREAALSYLRTVPYPINLERLSQRILRNQRYFMHGLTELLGRMNAARVGGSPKPFWAVDPGATLSPERLQKKIKEDLFDRLGKTPDEPGNFYPPTAPHLRTIEITLSRPSDLGVLMRNLEKDIPGFALRLGKDPQTGQLAALPKKETGVHAGCLSVSGTQDGIPITLRVRFQDNPQPG